MIKSTLKKCALMALFNVMLLLSARAASAAPSLTGVSEMTASPSANEGLNATAWVQSSTESKIAARQAYRLATRQLDVALRDKKWSAALEQAIPFNKLPPAVILDLDETVLDNSPYFARLARDNGIYSDESWIRWTAQAQAPAIEGSVQFLQYAASKGVQIFYISNRLQVEEAATRENLRRLGCPIQGPEDHVFLKGEQGWTSDKVPRRLVVAQKYRVLLLLGDDLNDFVKARSLTLPQRDELYTKYQNNWGERWILLSNPMYGSWEDALYGFSDVPREEMIRRKYGVLDYREPVTSPTAPGATVPTP